LIPTPGIVRRDRRGAFSLVEVTLAIGIVGFAFVSILGMLPIGLNTFHKAMDASVTAQIAQRVIGSVQQTDFSLVANAIPSARYFDGEGEEVDLTKSPDADWIYKAFVSVNKVNQSTGGIGGLSSSNLRSVLVKVVNDPGKTTKSKDDVTETQGITIQNYSAIIAENQ
jgi:uncharacterized protein (TIGR02598 family)